jgi:hypothetical protein
MQFQTRWETDMAILLKRKKARLDFMGCATRCQQPLNGTIDKKTAAG